MTKTQDIDRVAVNEKGIPVFICRADSSPICATAEVLVALEHDILEETDLIRAGFPVSDTPSSSADELIGRTQ